MITWPGGSKNAALAACNLAQYQPRLTPALHILSGTTYRHEDNCYIAQEQHSLGRLLFDEEGTQDSCPDGRGECEHERVIQRQQ